MHAKMYCSLIVNHKLLQPPHRQSQSVALVLNHYCWHIGIYFIGCTTLIESESDNLPPTVVRVASFDANR